MTCDEFTDIVSDYLEGNLPYGERIGVWFHTILCEHCRRYMQQMREVVELNREVGEQDQLRPEGPDPEIKDELLEQYRDTRDDE